MKAARHYRWVLPALTLAVAVLVFQLLTVFGLRVYERPVARGYAGLVNIVNILKDDWRWLLGSTGVALVPLLINAWFRTVAERTISRPPGWRLLHFFTFIYSPKTVARVFRRAILDMQKEHIDALATRQSWLARWVLVRGYWSVWAAVFAQAPLSLLKRLFELWKAAN